MLKYKHYCMLVQYSNPFQSKYGPLRDDFRLFSVFESLLFSIDFTTREKGSASCSDWCVLDGYTGGERSSDIGVYPDSDP